ncbi:MAG: HEAT repeat domain-containing protein [Sorangiineae bacterium]|nr:HEAT repeat domain-containing protein [Polyangiaceae bacterium]MEB2322402.1 HEAT repeat domain-containing protein [Sorangiineae bacterium]
MSRSLSWLFLALALVVTVPAGARPDVPTLIERLERGPDFRVRVQAALELGKTRSAAARRPLEAALDDGNAAVRAAAAAALKALGDRRALPALKAHAADESPAVRAQVKATIGALEKAGAADKPKVLVKLGKIRDGAGTSSGTLMVEVERASRDRLGELPGVQVLTDDDDYKAAAAKRKPPVVMVTGRLKKLQASRQGVEIVYSARVEYVVHRMPEESIAGTVSGSASAKASPEEARDRRRDAELRHAVLVAAVDSAIRRAPEALMHAAE